MSLLSLASPPHRQPSVRAAIRCGQARLRPLRHGETEPLRAVFDAMTPESRRNRYLVPVPRLTPRMLAALAAVDGSRHVAWLASVDGRPAGIGRFVTVGPHAAEIAYEVADGFHGLGLGAVLLDTVTTVAAAAGVRRLQATVLESNLASQHLLSQVGLELRPAGDRLLEADGPYHLMDRPRVDRPSVVGLARAARRAAA